MVSVTSGCWSWCSAYFHSVYNCNPVRLILSPSPRTGDVTEMQRSKVPCPQSHASEGGGRIPTEQSDSRSARQTLKSLPILEQTQKHIVKEKYLKGLCSQSFLL